MKILAIRTDKPEAELYIYDRHEKLAEMKWEAHRRLAGTIHKKISELLDLLSISLGDIEGVIYFKGPGSFTGLRIGASVANALAYAQNTSVIASKGDDWLRLGVDALLAGQTDKIVSPEYGEPARTTPPKK